MRTLVFVFVWVAFCGLGVGGWGAGTQHNSTSNSNSPTSTIQRPGPTDPIPATPPDKLVTQINALVPTNIKAADLLKELSENTIRNLSDAQLTAITNDERRNQLTALKVALNKSNVDLLKYWKENKTKMGASPESKAMRAALDKRMDEFKGLKDLHDLTGGAKEELFDKLLSMREQIKDSKFKTDPSKREKVMRDLVQTITAIDPTKRTDLQKSLQKALVETTDNDNKMLLQGLDLALEIERGVALNKSGKDGIKTISNEQLQKLKDHPFLAGFEKDSNKILAVRKFAQLQNIDQQRSKEYGNAVKIMNDPNASQADLTKAKAFLANYGDTSSWHATQFALSEGKDQKHLDGMVAAGKIQGTIDTDGNLHFSTSNHVTNGKPILNNFNILRDKNGLVHHVVNSGSPDNRKDLAAYAMAKGKQNDGGAYHTLEAKQKKEDYQELKVAQNKNEFQETLNKRAESQVIKELGVRTAANADNFDKKVAIAKKDILENTKIAGNDTDGLKWTPAFTTPEETITAAPPVTPKREEPPKTPTTAPDPVAPAKIKEKPEAPKTAEKPSIGKEIETAIKNGVDAAGNKPYYNERERGQELEEIRQKKAAERAKKLAAEEAKRKEGEDSKKGEEIPAKTPEVKAREDQIAAKKQELVGAKATRDAATSHVKELKSERKAETCGSLDFLCWRRKDHLEREIGKALDRVREHNNTIEKLKKDIGN